MSEQYPAAGGIGLPRQLIVQGKALYELSGDAWDRLKEVNDPPFLFQRNGQMVDVVTNADGIQRMRTLTRDAFRGHLARMLTFMTRVSGLLTPITPPSDVVADMMAAPVLAVPELSSIIETPFFTPEGHLVTTQGYDPTTRQLLHFPPGLEIPRVPIEPTDADVAEAKRLIFDELLADFSFATEADRAHAMALLLHPFAKGMIRGATPLHEVEAPVHGSGKSLLVQALAVAAVGRGLSSITEARNEEEWRKRLTAALLAGHQYLVIDNVNWQLSSSALSSAITEQSWTDRILGKSEMITVPVNCAWVITANNPSTSSELARRTVRIRIDTGTSMPWTRSGFKHPHLLEWAVEHRGELIAAALTLIQAWVIAGRPSGKVTLGSFEKWSEVMGGILGVAEIPGFLKNRNEVYAEGDHEDADWAAIVKVWLDKFGENSVTARQLFDLEEVQGLADGIVGTKTGHAARTVFGKALAKMRDRIFFKHRIRRGGKDRNDIVLYQLEPIQNAGDAGVAGVGHGHSSAKSSTEAVRPTTDTTPANPGNPGASSDEVIDLNF